MYNNTIWLHFYRTRKTKLKITYTGNEFKFFFLSLCCCCVAYDMYDNYRYMHLIIKLYDIMFFINTLLLFPTRDFSAFAT